MTKTKTLADGINKPPASLSKGVNGEAGPAPASARISDQFGNDLGGTTPTRNVGGNQLGDNAPIRSNGRGGAGGVGNHTVHVNIANLHGGGDPKAIGDEVGRRTREAINGSMHDVDPGGFA